MLICVNCGATNARQVLSGCSLGGQQRRHDWRDEVRPFADEDFDTLRWRMDRLALKLTGSYAAAAAWSRVVALEGSREAIYACALYLEKADKRADLLLAVTHEVRIRVEELRAGLPKPDAAVPTT